MMFVLTVFPQGHSILSTKEPLTEKQMHEIRAKFREWKASNGDVLVVGQMKVVTALDVELDIEPDDTINVDEADPD